MSLTLAPSASSLTPSRWTPTSWLGGSESHLELRNGVKRGTRRNITTLQISPSKILYYRTLPLRALSAAPFRAPQPANNKGWTAPLLEPSLGFESVLSPR